MNTMWLEFKFIFFFIYQDFDKQLKCIKWQTK